MEGHTPKVTVAEKYDVRFVEAECSQADFYWLVNYLEENTDIVLYSSPDRLIFELDFNELDEWLCDIIENTDEEERKNNKLFVIGDEILNAADPNNDYIRIELNNK